MNLAYVLHKHSRPASIIRKIFQPPTFILMGILAKFALLRHRLQLIGTERFTDAFKFRSTYRPLITISNHHSCLDDFFLFGSLLSLMQLADVDKCRWTLTAVDICFTNRIHSYFFSWFRGIPVWRKVRHPKTGVVLHAGGGVYQPSLDFTINLLNAGQWLHVFPQGRIVHPHERVDEAKLRLRWGIGRLIAETKLEPIVLPIWHCGFDELNPSEAPNNCQTLKRIFGRSRCLTISIGNAIDLSELRRQFDQQSDQYYNSPTVRSKFHARITSLVQNKLYSLKKRTECDHLKFMDKFVKC